jgi:hypothetical protein
LIIRFELFLNTSVKDTTNKKFYDYIKADYNKARELTKCLEWDTILEGKNIERDWLKFKEALLCIRETCVPYKTRKSAKSKWITKKVMRHRRAKLRAWKNYKNLKSVESYNKYKIKRNISLKVNRQALKDYETKLANNIKNDSKSFFAYVNNKNCRGTRIGPIKDKNSRIIIDDKLMVESFNDYFCSVFTIETNTDFPIPNIKNLDSFNNGLTSINITEKDVLTKLNFLKLNKGAGPDDIHPRFLYELRSIISKPLCKIFNTSLNLGCLPDDWRCANVTPLFKKGSKSETKNYRPVSLTSIPCKILESIIKDNIDKHLQKFCLINDSQHGFTSGRSCLTNLLDFYNHITSLSDQGNSVDIIYLDFAKAFDKVPHNRLIAKLEAYGIKDTVCNWIKAWLHNRKQRVVVNGISSEWRAVSSGVPQGSVLGPQLFNIYIDDFDDNLKSKIAKFADDTKLGKSVNNNYDKQELQSDLLKVYEWSKIWLMEFNYDKCVCMHIGKNNAQFQYSLGLSLLNSSDKEKDLGIIIDNCFKFSYQCAAAVKKANKLLGVIKRKVKNKGSEIILRLYKTLIRPNLEYCIPFWNPQLKKDTDLLEGVQRRALKMINGYHQLSYSNRLVKSNIPSLYKRRVRGDLIQLYKIFKGYAKMKFESMFTFSNNNSLRGHSLKIFKNRCMSNTRKHFFNNRFINIWNDLPEHIVNSSSINLFKNNLDKYKNYYCDDF